MPSVTSLYENEESILHANGMNPKNYGVARRNDQEFMLLCYLTRDNVIIRHQLEDNDDMETIVMREPDATERQTLRENGIDAADFGVTYRDPTTIQLKHHVTGYCVEVWKGDRKW